MDLFAGKSVTERNKMIAAIVLGLVALVALYLAFGRSLFASNKTIAASASPTPKPTASSSNPNALKMPSVNEQNQIAVSTQIVYSPDAIEGSPDPGRNIFAFFEPPRPCPGCTPSPTPIPTPIKTPVPTPTPLMHLEFVTPQTVYAGAAGFKLEVNGDRFDPTAKIYFREMEVPTQFVSAQKLVGTVPPIMIAIEGPARVIVQTADGKKYSEQTQINIQPPPKPQFDYIGMIGRARHNNDTAYFMEKNKGPSALPTSARLNDVIGGRFKLISISSTETVFEDVNLGFKHRLKLTNPPPGSSAGSGAPIRPGFPTDGNMYQVYPDMQNIPGIPGNIQRVNPQQQPNGRPTPAKKDEDDDGNPGNDRQ
jgi:hypothetical protein